MSNFTIVVAMVRMSLLLYWKNLVCELKIDMQEKKCGPGLVFRCAHSSSPCAFSVGHYYLDYGLAIALWSSVQILF